MANDSRAAQIEHLLAVYRNGRPNVTNLDVLQILISDNGYRARTDVMCGAKMKQGTASVHRYPFNWKSPAREDELKSFHTLHVPFECRVVDDPHREERSTLAEARKTVSVTL